MNRDFTLTIYHSLLTALRQAGYSFQTLEQFCEAPVKKVILLRHDVDNFPIRSWRMAQVEASLGIQASYYFRILPVSFQPKYITAIRDLSHEIGYHYEDLTLAKGDLKVAYNLFQQHLKILRGFYPVRTACMHGSPRTKWDNKDVWKHFNYRDDGIIAEPYFDLDYKDFLYLTDTGRAWDGDKFSIRDFVEQQHPHRFHHTQDILRYDLSSLPNQIMINTHPARWNNLYLPWLIEYILQNCKNPIKFLLKKVINL